MAAEKEEGQKSEPEREQTPYAECYYRLLAMREQYLGKISHLETLQKKLSAAQADPLVRIYCWEDKEAYSMAAVSKPTMGFAGLREPIENPIPVGATRVSPPFYAQQLEDAFNFFQRKVSEVEENIERLDGKPGGRGISCYMVNKEIEIEFVEKRPCGFVVEKIAGCS